MFSGILSISLDDRISNFSLALFILTARRFSYITIFSSFLSIYRARWRLRLCFDIMSYAGSSVRMHTAFRESRAQQSIFFDTLAIAWCRWATILFILRYAHASSRFFGLHSLLLRAYDALQAWLGCYWGLPHVSSKLSIYLPWELPRHESSHVEIWDIAIIAILSLMIRKKLPAIL